MLTGDMDSFDRLEHWLILAALGLCCVTGVLALIILMI